MLHHPITPSGPNYIHASTHSTRRAYTMGLAWPLTYAANGDSMNSTTLHSSPKSSTDAPMPSKSSGVATAVQSWG